MIKQPTDFDINRFNASYDFFVRRQRELTEERINQLNADTLQPPPPKTLFDKTVTEIIIDTIDMPSKVLQDIVIGEDIGDIIMKENRLFSAGLIVMSLSVFAFVIYHFISFQKPGSYMLEMCR